MADAESPSYDHKPTDQPLLRAAEVARLLGIPLTAVYRLPIPRVELSLSQNVELDVASNPPTLVCTECGGRSELDLDDGEDSSGTNARGSGRPRPAR